MHSSDSDPGMRYGSESDIDDDVLMDTLGARGAQQGAGDSTSEGDDGKQFFGVQGSASLLRAKLKETSLRLKQSYEETQLLKQEIDTLRRREIDMCGVSLKLEQKFNSIQAQVDGIKATVRTHLLNPITDAEYQAIERMNEEDRDLLDTIKMGIFQQLGSLKASRDVAVRRSSEMAAELESLTAKNKQLSQDLLDAQIIREGEANTFKRQLANFEQRASLIAELSGKVQDLESRLKGSNVEQEQFLNAKLLAATKTDELARVQFRLKEAEGETHRAKSQLECSEQKLDILKSEYYDLRLKYNQRIMELEGNLRVADEKLKVLADMENEAEMFMANIANAIDDGMNDGHELALRGTNSTMALAEACGKLMTVPSSRKVHHAITVTRKCLHLENQLTAAKSEISKLEDRSQRLERSLEMCRSALNQSNSPFALAEQAVEKLTKENDVLRSQNNAIRSENAALHDKVKELVADVELLSKHRVELLRIRELLHSLGAPSPAQYCSQPGAEPSQEQSRGQERFQQRGSSPKFSVTARMRNEESSSILVSEPTFVVHTSMTDELRRDKHTGAFVASPELIEIN